MNQTKAVMDPGLTDAMTALKQDIFRSINCVKIGTVQLFDGTKKTASIKLLFKRVLPNGTIASYPVLVDCPVFTLQGGGGAVQMPISAGDQCIVLFSDRNIDAWFKTGSESAPLNGRAHDLSDGIALVGLNSLTSSLANYETGKLRIFFDGAEIDFASSILTLKNATTTLLQLMEGFIDVLKTLEVNGPIALTAGSIAALEAYKLQFEELLG